MEIIDVNSNSYNKQKLTLWKNAVAVLQQVAHTRMLTSEFKRLNKLI